MELKPLAEVDLRDALGPINRAVTGHYLPAVRTVSQLRERVNLGVLDLKLSRCAFLGRDLVGACLVERVDEFAHLDAIGVDPLAQQRGVGHALLEAACVAAEAAGVRLFTAEVTDSDAASVATLSSAGFAARQALSRWELQGDPRPVPLPEEMGPETTGRPQGPGQMLASPVELGEALSFLGAAEPKDLANYLTFWQQPVVLRRVQSKLTAMLLLQIGARAGAGALTDPQGPVQAAVIFEKDRQRILRAGGEAGPLSALVGLLLRRHGVTHAPDLPGDERTAAALAEAGLVRVALRSEMARELP